MIAKLPKKRLTRIASLVSLGVALTLVCIKVWAWLETGSIALLTSAADGLVDVLASMVTLVGVYYAQRPADRGHRFGHGKAEAIAAFVQAMLLAAAGVALGIESVSRLITPQALATQGLGIIVIVVSTLCASLLVIMQTLVVKYTQSTAIAADRAHYITDIAVNIAVLCALVLEHQCGWIRADASGALAISCYMDWNARSMIRAAMLKLLDRELDSADRRRITAAALSCPGVEGVHDLRTRNGGDRVFVELHVEVDGQLTVDAGHAICDNAEAAVRALFSVAEVSAHLEPAGIADERLDDLIK
ncbi:Ferrous-iron efflux pump FieF [Sodalis praecaptivus]|uniref:cation diffusion facilitator family transporter n=1 Tax=Sodalis praecaptivus TaxID=1239307 RepID=UPI0027F03DD0|nr:cation diffusion facilitator family transporter [Sodalis praecaptivus]CAJ0998423.1 Ferrous-iron efflux pump FieF [Sodalis praecaptivus]